MEIRINPFRCSRSALAAAVTSLTEILIKRNDDFARQNGSVLTPKDIHEHKIVTAGTATTSGPVEAPAPSPSEIFGGAAGGIPPVQTAGSGAGVNPSATVPAAPPVTSPPPPPVSTTANAGASVSPPSAGTIVNVDAACLPWDARIHSENKTINKGDGLWKKKRGVSLFDVQSVEAELRALMDMPRAPAPAAATVPPPPAVTTTVPPPPPPPPVVSTVPPPPANEPGPASITTFTQFMAFFSKLQADGVIDAASMAEFFKAKGINGAIMLSKRPDLIPSVVSELCALCGIVYAA
jgi:hypothetical protein